MSNPLAPFILAAAATAAALVFTAPALADTANDQAALLAAAPFDRRLSDQDMSGMRGGAGLLGLPFGSSTFVQVGATTHAQFQSGSPSSSSSVLSLGGSSLSASASLGAGAGVPPVSISRTFAQTYSVSTSHTFSVSFSLGL